MGDAVGIACFFAFLFFGDVILAVSPGMVALVVAAVTVAEAPMESAGVATVVERAVVMPLLFKIVPWVVAA